MKTALLLVLDLDGTIFRTESITVPAVLRSCRELGVPPPSRLQILDAIGLPSAQFFEELFVGSPQGERAQLEVTASTYERDGIHSQGELYPGAAEALSRLRAHGFQFGLVTNGSVEYARAVLSNFQLLDLFSWVEARRGERSKSQAVRDLLLEAEAEIALVVGDSEEDIHSGRQNDCDTVAASYGYGSATRAGPTFRIDTIEELESVALTWRVFRSVRLAAKHRSSGTPFVVGVSGRDLSGKTTFATHLGDYLRASRHSVQIVHLDDFHNPRETRTRGDTPVLAYLENAFDLRRLRTELLDPARAVGHVTRTLELLDVDSNDFTVERKFEISPETVVVLEGVLLFREPIDSCIDYRVFLDVSVEEALRRARERDVPRYGEGILDAYRQKYFKAEEHYRRSWEPVKRADLHVDNGNPSEPRLL